MMMSVSHCAIAIAGVSVALGTGDPWALVAAAVGSQLPDLDTTTSLCGAVMFPIARFIETRYAHRTLTHSLLSTGIIGAVSLPLGWYVGWHIWGALVLGQFLGWFADCFTKSGCAAFFPSPVRLVIPGNPKVRLSTHSPAEYWVLAIAVVVAVASVNLASAGGISESFGRVFLNDTGTVAKLFTKYPDRLITVHVTGLNIASSEAVDRTFTVLEVSGDNLIVQGLPGEVYKVGGAPDCQVSPVSVRGEVGRVSVVKVRHQALQDISVSDWVKRMPQNALVSGVVNVEDLQEVRPRFVIGRYPVVRIFGGQVELSNASPGELRRQLSGQWVRNGQVVVKVRE